MKIGAGDDKNDNEKEVACLEDPTPADMKIGASDDKNDNEKEVACLEDPTPADTKIGASDDKNAICKSKGTKKRKKLFQ